MNRTYKKPSNMLCGSACLYFIKRYLFSHDQDFHLDKNLMWITDIALWAKENLDCGIILSCYNSNLYNDFLNADSKEIEEFIGFKKIKEYINNNPITQYAITKRSIDRLLRQNRILIMNVSSAIFNRDNTMNGGHYIVVIFQEKDYYIVANPGMRNIYIERYKKEHIIKSCKSFGGWIISINNNAR